MRLHKVRAALAVTLLSVGLVAGGAVSALASPVTGDHTRIVNPDPVDYTPQVQDGAIKSIVKVGNRIFVGGSFTAVKEVGGAKPVLTRNRLFAFDAATGAIDPDWAPNVDRDEVSVLLPAADGQSIYVGGGFNQINGVAAFKLARLDLATGLALPNFAPQLDARVKDLRLVGSRLFVGGFFTQVGGVARAAFATLNADSGVLDNFSSLVFSGNQPGDASITNVYKMDVSPDGSKLVAVGNFNAVNGQTKRQIVMLDLTGASAALANWDTVRYADQCSQSFDTYLRDIDFSPDGSFFVVTTTGAYFSGRMCDTQSRWESAATGSGKQPTWINTTGGDTTYAVEITPAAVYVGGHFRWANNPFRGDRADQGAVSREGIAALDPVNGLPFQWNPGRTRGVGVFDLLATPEGLWMGSDTDEAGGEFHPKLALFPLVGGKQVPANLTGTLPGDVYYAGGLSGFPQPPNYLRHRSFNGTTTGAAVEHNTLGIDWRTLRGAFMINGELFYGNASDGKFFRRTFDGASAGTPTEINTGDLLVNMTTWHTNVKTINGMVFARGRIYYTRGTTNTLFYRAFTPESNVVGAQEITAPLSGVSGVNWANVGGMFTHGGNLYYVNNADTGKLYRIAFPDGVPTGAPQVVSTADWRGRAVFLYTGAPNTAPTASFTSNCTQLACTFNGAGSTDPDGSIASYAWDFGDSTTDTGVSPSHSYAADGVYTVTLTVTDNRGAQASTTRTVTLGANQTTVGFRDTAGFNGNVSAATVTVPASVQEGDAMLAVLAQNNSTTTVTAPVGWIRVDGQSISGSAASTLFRKVATAADAGQPATFGLSAITKVDLRLVAYSGTPTTDPIASVAKGVDAATVTDHPSPSAPVTGTGAWGVTFWADKSSTTTAWTAPAGTQNRGTAIGAGSGRMTSLVVDSGSPVPTGSYGGLTAQTDAVSKALAWTVILGRADAPNALPTASFTGACTYLSCAFDASASSDSDGSITTYAWNFGDGATGTGVTTSHAYSAAGTYTVALTVTDNRGGTATTTQSRIVAPGEVAFHGTAGFNGNTTSAAVTVPATVQTGDAMLAVLALNSATTTVTTPAGWTQVDTQTSNGAVSTLYRRVAVAGEAGQRVTFALSATTKVDLRLVAYAGTSTSQPIAAVAKGADAAAVTDHPSPVADVTGPGTWAVTFWADKTSATTAWTAPAGVQNRGTAIGVGSGRITALVVDSGAPVPAGPYGGLVASTDAASRAMSWTVVLNQAT